MKAKGETHCIFPKDVGAAISRELKKECHTRIYLSVPLLWDLPKDGEDPERYFKNQFHGAPVMRPACRLSQRLTGTLAPWDWRQGSYTGTQ